MVMYTGLHAETHLPVGPGWRSKREKEGEVKGTLRNRERDT